MIYRLDDAPQGSEVWHDLRKKYLTGSRFGTAAGVDPFFDAHALAYEIITGKKRKVEPEAQARMNLGIKNEDRVRKLYEREFGVKVVEVGLAISEVYKGLASSLDGMVGDDGAIEIKFVKEIKAPLRAVARLPWDKKRFDHIYAPYYAQIQGGLAITDRQWCDFVVYSYTTRELYTEKIFFNSEYWEDFLLPKLKYFQEVIIKEVETQLEFYSNKYHHLFFCD